MDGESAVECQRHATDIAKFMSRMEVSRPDLLRATETFRVLRRCGYVFRKQAEEEGGDEFFYWSFVTTTIDEFLSHSWHGEAWKKIILLLVLKNGPAAVIVGTCCSLPMMVLFSLGNLPGYAKPHWFGEDQTVLNSMWSLGVGTLAALATLIWFQPRTSMFLDRVCIDQTTTLSKAEGVLNVGAFLKHSKSMLVLWDSSYVTRLWCVFELAAFLKSHRDEWTKHLQIRPTVLAPVSIGLSLSLFGFMLALLTIPFANPLFGTCLLLVLGSVVFYVSFASFRAYYRDVEIMQEQLNNFDVAKTKCYCCSANHLTSSGDPLGVCDREIVLNCITTWYGSVEAFESAVQNTVLPALRHQLGHQPFPYLWLLCASAPLVWGQMDAVAGQLRAGQTSSAILFVLQGLMWWLAAFPILSVLWVGFAHRLRLRPTYRVLDVLINVVGMTSLFVFLCVVWGLQEVMGMPFEDEIHGRAFFLGFMLTVTAVVWWGVSPCRILCTRVGGSGRNANRV